MADFDWYKVRFLESAENLKPLVHVRTGRTPSTQIAREIAACLQQGRLLYEAAQQSPVEIRPLQQFYGMVGFGKALILARRVVSLAQLPPAHGVSDASGMGCRIADLTVRVNTAGTFQEFNDVVKSLTRLCYYDNATRPWALYQQSASSQQLSGLDISLREILGRIPGLESLFRNTFGHEGGTESVEVQHPFNADSSGEWRIRISDRELFTNLTSVQRIVSRWRDRFPFLKRWRFISASQAWGQSFFYFANRDAAGADEFSEECLSHNTFATTPGDAFFHFAQRLPPLAGGYSGSGAFAISPLKGDIYPSEFALHFMALYILSSLVRYRPQTWAHAVSRTAVSDSPADDQALALIEQFLEINRTTVPSFVITALNPNEDSYVAVTGEAAGIDHAKGPQ